MPLSYVYLILAIAAEVAATSALPATAGFTRPGPGLAVVAGYALAFYLLSLAVQAMPVGIAYAIWAGLGIVGVALVGIVLYGQRLDAPAILGMAMIIAGVIVINVFSQATAH